MDERSHEVAATRVVGRDKHSAEIVIELMFANQVPQIIRMKASVANNLCDQIHSSQFGGDD